VVSNRRTAIPNYRRHRVPGGSYFFTVNLLKRRDNDLLTRHMDELRASVRTVHRAHRFTIGAWVVLPDHLHCVWTLPPGDDAFSKRWRLIKTIFARSLPMSAQTQRRTCSAGHAAL
jgi:putative transposase